MNISVQEALRYLGAGNGAPQELITTTEQIALRLQQQLSPRWVFRMCTLEKQSEGILLKEPKILLSGNSASKMLNDCDRAVLLACSIGAEFDRMLRAEQARDMSRAVILDACGSAYVEAGCDEAEKEIAAHFPGSFLTDRFSPGYGDLPLELQPAICAALDTQRRIGVTVGQSLLMNPCKSVTAIIGLSDRPQAARIRGCGYCALQKSCLYRKRGQYCGN